MLLALICFMPFVHNRGDVRLLQQSFMTLDPNSIRAQRCPRQRVQVAGFFGKGRGVNPKSLLQSGTTSTCQQTNESSM